MTMLLTSRIVSFSKMITDQGIVSTTSDDQVSPSQPVKENLSFYQQVSQLNKQDYVNLRTDQERSCQRSADNAVKF